MNQPHWRFICSDLHIESPNFDENRLLRDLSAARRVNARILVNGDLFDAICPKDKRWTPTCVRKSLRGKDDIFEACTDYAAKIFEPYCDLIDVIGIGNHERTWIKWHYADPVAAVIKKLNDTLKAQKNKHRIAHGGVAGYILTRFVLPNANTGHKNTIQHKLLYFHGAGGESPVTKGTIDINRKAANFEYDCVTFGHKHNRLFVDDVVLCVSNSGRLRYRETKAIPTGSYVKNWIKTPQETPLSYNYSEDWAAPPKPLGGMFLSITPVTTSNYQEREKKPYNKKGITVLRQEVCTFPVEPPPILPSGSQGKAKR